MQTYDQPVPTTEQQLRDALEGADEAIIAQIELNEELRSQLEIAESCLSSFGQVRYRKALKEANLLP